MRGGLLLVSTVLLVLLVGRQVVDAEDAAIGVVDGREAATAVEHRADDRRPGDAVPAVCVRAATRGVAGLDEADAGDQPPLQPAARIGGSDMPGGLHIGAGGDGRD